jgi:hypothetical protein
MTVTRKPLRRICGVQVVPKTVSRKADVEKEAVSPPQVVPGGLARCVYHPVMTPMWSWEGRPYPEIVSLERSMVLYHDPVPLPVDFYSLDPDLMAFKHNGETVGPTAQEVVAKRMAVYNLRIGAECLMLLKTIKRDDLKEKLANKVTRLDDALTLGSSQIIADEYEELAEISLEYSSVPIGTLAFRSWTRRRALILWSMDRSVSVVPKCPLDLATIILLDTQRVNFMPASLVRALIPIIREPIILSSNALFIRHDQANRTVCVLRLKNVAVDDHSVYEYQVQTNEPSKIKSDPQKGSVFANQIVDVTIKFIGPVDAEAKSPKIRILFVKKAGVGPEQYAKSVTLYRRDPYQPSSRSPRPADYMPMPGVGREVSIRVIDGTMYTTSPARLATQPAAPPVAWFERMSCVER